MLGKYQIENRASNKVYELLILAERLGQRVVQALPTIKKKKNETMSQINLNSMTFFVIGRDSNKEGISNKNLLNGLQSNVDRELQQSEIQKAIKWLINKGFILKIGKKYALTLTGEIIFEEESNLENRLKSIELTFNRIEKGKIHIPELSGELMKLIKFNFDISEIGYLISKLKTLNKEIFEKNMSGRIIIAILKISDYNIDKFNKAVSQTKEDWRDTLLGAGFENDIKLHENWVLEQMSNISKENFSSRKNDKLIQNQIQPKNKNKPNFITRLLRNFIGNDKDQTEHESSSLLIL